MRLLRSRRPGYTDEVTAHLEPRIATEDDYDQRTELLSTAFLSDPEMADAEKFRMIDELERTHVVEDSGTVVGTGQLLTRELSVPGGVLPAAHVSAVAVAPTHRRRGLLTSIIDAQLRAVRERGTEPITVLWASEGGIYGRFGYGLASWHASYDVDVRETSVPGQRPAGASLRRVVPGDHVSALAGLYDRVFRDRLERPGWSSRPSHWWQFLTTDPPNERRGMSAERAVLYEQDGQLDGYARYRTKNEHSQHGPAGEAAVTEVVAATEEAYAAVWRYLLSIDLVRTVRYRFGAMDEQLPYVVTNPQGLGVSVSPALWVRIADVPAALAARKYAVPVDVVLEVTDSFVSANGGRWRLVGDETSARCEPSDAEADVVLDIRELGSAYLGGVALTTLAAAGLVRGRTPGAVERVSTAFGWHRAPASVESF